MSEERDDLASAQRELLDALRDDSSSLPGFDAKRLAANRSMLHRKRRSAVAKFAPELARSLRSDFEATFDRYAAAHALNEKGIRDDALRFAAFVLSQPKDPNRSTDVRHAAAMLILQGRWFRIATIDRAAWLTFRFGSRAKAVCFLRVRASPARERT